MQLSLPALLTLLCIALAPAPLRAQQPDPHARQTAADFANAYQAWQQAHDADEKIKLGERVLALEPTVASWPLAVSRSLLKAQVSGALGNLYVSRPGGVRADNLEKAIGYLQVALGERTRAADPVDWAAIHNDLGVAYWGRIRGARADNQETAIAHLEAAQTVFTREAYPDRWGQLQNNLAIVYWSRIRGEADTNVEEAIARFEAALSIFTRERDPNGWAATQNNLANAYTRRVRGDQADNREMAIKHLEAALSSFRAMGILSSGRRPRTIWRLPIRVACAGDAAEKPGNGHRRF
ncbi:MAG: hypothetical protein WDN31_03900 [Hyphomicrobium sp.]